MIWDIVLGIGFLIAVGLWVWVMISGPAPIVTIWHSWEPGTFDFKLWKKKKNICIKCRVRTLHTKNWNTKQRLMFFSNSYSLYCSVNFTLCCNTATVCRHQAIFFTQFSQNKIQYVSEIIVVLRYVITPRAKKIKIFWCKMLCIFRF